MSTAATSWQVAPHGPALLPAAPRVGSRPASHSLSVCPSLSVSLPSLALSVRLYTGRSEVERLALSPAPSSTSDSTEVDVRRKVELSRCLRRSSQLSPYLAPIYGTAAMPRSREPKVAPRAIATVEEVKEVSAKLVHTIVTAKRIKQRSR